MPVRKVVKRHPTKVTRYTIWDNFDRHVRELKSIGATDKDLAPLKKAAEAVDKEEQVDAKNKGRNPSLNNKTLSDITVPYTCVNGWVIQPPSKLARRWASNAMLKVTGGEPPSDKLGILYSMLASLWTLKSWGDGKRDAVMQIITAPGRLAELVIQLEDVGAKWDIDALTEDFYLLMGFLKKNSKRMKFLLLCQFIRTNCLERSIPPSSGSS